MYIFKHRTLRFFHYFIGCSILGLAACVSKYYTTDPHKLASVQILRTATLPAPLGMVYIPAGKLEWVDTVVHRVSMSAYFMDVTETTNQQYRHFVDWIADSIAVTDYLKDKKYFLYKITKKRNNAGNKMTDSTTTRINWNQINGSTTPLWQSKNNEIYSKLEGKLVYTSKDGIVRLITGRVKFGYNQYFVDRASGHINAIKDTVEVYPDMGVWGKDKPASGTQFYEDKYFINKSYDLFPVVGVTWRQACAYAYWRGEADQTFMASKYGMKFSLPTEKQYYYAALSGINKQDPDTIPDYKLKRSEQYILGKNPENYIIKDKKRYVRGANYKQGEGNYSEDGWIYTAPVKFYDPNIWGIYQLKGNVSEWTLDDFIPFPANFADDVNPLIRYDPRTKGPKEYELKRVFGGSWNSPKKELNPLYSDAQLQNYTSSMLGFRCVLLAPDPIKVR